MRILLFSAVKSSKRLSMDRWIVGPLYMYDFEIEKKEVWPCFMAFGTADTVYI
jgi:hypothetical protein